MGEIVKARVISCQQGLDGCVKAEKKVENVLVERKEECTKRLVTD